MSVRRFVTLGVVLGLLVGVYMLPAQAKKKKKAKPVATTMFMHGPSPFGEVDGAQWLADGNGPVSPLTMDGVEPAAGPPKSMNYFSPALNDQCTGLPLAFPTFTGNLVGTIVGDAKMTLHFVSAPTTIKARIWADIGAFSACNEAHIEPASEVDVEVPGGQGEVEVVFPDLKLTATQHIMIEILAPSSAEWGGKVGRLLYDSTDAASQITFGCVPASGKSCLPS